MKYTKGNKKKLIADCEAIKRKLGMGNMHVSYHFRKADGHTLADSLMYVYGWKSKITFYDRFFQSDAELQHHTILHEFVHTMMMPLDSQIEWIVEAQPKAKQSKMRWNLRTAREIVVDRIAGTLKELL